MRTAITADYLRSHVLLIFLFLGLASFAQPSVLRGTVIDNASGETLIGATVLIKGTTIGAVTDIHGRFEIAIDSPPPYTLVISFVGYAGQELEVTDPGKRIQIKLGTDRVLLQEAEVVGSRISDKQKQAPLTVESMDVIAIREAPSGDFYESLGALKGVDMVAASLGFKVINMRGFNSTSPVRSLQLIDGVDNQSPGLNFSLGNFLGAGELDLQRVDLIIGASSAFYGPNAFNGVIIMTTKDPFRYRGLTVMAKAGERELREVALRYAHVFKNRGDREHFAFKVNLHYFEALDWEADNMAPTEGSPHDEMNPGGYDAVNRYGDETEFIGGRTTWGLGSFFRDGYRETDLADYDTDNLKSSVALHYRVTDSLEMIATTSVSTGTTVYQGDNRYRLKNIFFMQNKLELNAHDRGFLRAYLTTEDAGDSYDIVFTAFRLQDRAKDDNTWFRDYTNFWVSQGYSAQVFNSPGFPQPVFDPGPPPTFVFDQTAIEQWYLDHAPLLNEFHGNARAYANSEASSVGTGQQFRSRIEPGTEEFDRALSEITSTTFQDGGTRFFDRSALGHVHGEYRFQWEGFRTIIGGNFRQYRPYSQGNIFSDTAGVRITNEEFGVYTGLEKRILENKLKLTGTIRMDKNVNFPYVFSPAASGVYSFDADNILRLSFSSAVRNPTLADQYLYYNVGRAILLGNLNGVNDLVTIPSLMSSFASSADTLEYFDIAPLVPEKVRTVEIGFRNKIGKNLLVDGSYYYSYYRDFIGFQIGADVDVSPFTNQVIFSSIQPYRVAANATRTVTTQGFSIGLSYYWRSYAFNGNYSWNKLNTGEDDPIIPAFNTPEHKFNLGVSARDMNKVILGIPFQHYGFGVNYRWVESFLFEGSPQFTGTIPSYGLVDAQISKHIPGAELTVKLGASNLLDHEVFMVYGGPRVGRMAYLSLTYEPAWSRRST